MLTIPADQLPCSEDELRAKFAAYLDSLVAHTKTVARPAPWPEHEVLRAILEDYDRDFVVVYPPPAPLPPVEPAPRMFNHL